MTKEPSDKNFDVTELDDSSLDDVAGGILPDIDISCEDNDDCPNNGCVEGCNPNVGCGQELQ
jgi:hypothetical protein